MITKHAEAVAQRCSVKKVFLEISQNSQENTCARWTLFFTEHLRWLLLNMINLTLQWLKYNSIYRERKYKERQKKTKGILGKNRYDGCAIWVLILSWIAKTNLKNWRNFSYTYSCCCYNVLHMLLFSSMFSLRLTSFGNEKFPFRKGNFPKVRHRIPMNITDLTLKDFS